MKLLKKTIFVAYFLILVTALMLIGFENKCQAGRIRTLVLRPDQPGKIYLSYGESTAISFPSKPEKLVPGSPSKAVIEFVNNTDISVSPTSQKNFGNLIVYTKAGRFVILFEPGSPSNYDDIVNIRFFSVGPTLRLSSDTYHAEILTVTMQPRLKGVKVATGQPTALFSGNDKIISGGEVFTLLEDVKSVRCAGCVISKKAQDPQIICSVPIKTLTCENSKYSRITISRGVK